MDEMHALGRGAEGRLDIDRQRRRRAADRVLIVGDRRRRRRQPELVEQRREADFALQPQESREVGQGDGDLRRQPVAKTGEQERLLVRGIENVEAAAGEERDDALEIEARIDAETRRGVQAATELRETREAERIAVDHLDMESGPAEASQQLARRKARPLRHQNAYGPVGGRGHRPARSLLHRKGTLSRCKKRRDATEWLGAPVAIARGRDWATWQIVL